GSVRCVYETALYELDRSAQESRGHQGRHHGRDSRRLGLDPTKGREEQIERAIARGELKWTGKAFVVPRSRWLVLDGIIRELF
ncbi:MAG: hypothetical protein N2515_09925, partial [Deltaproteobacteria bacterium]|nr:hypothetical protein [Deltaproteobacteria bacterium]